MGEAGAFPECLEDILAVVPPHRARHRPGHLLRGGAPGRRADPAPRHVPVDVHALADGLRRVRPPGLRVVGRLVPLVPRRPRRASRGQPGRADADPGGACGRGFAPARRGGVRTHRLQPEPDRALPDVFHPGLRVLLQHHLAADLPGEGAWVLLDAARAAGGPAADPQLAGRPDGGAGDRSRGPGLWTPDRPVRHRHDLAPGRGRGPDRRRRGGGPAPLGHPDRRWRARPTASCWARPGAFASTSPARTRAWSPAR